MIDLIFFRGTEITFVRTDGHNVRFASSLDPNKYSSFSGLKLDYEGCIKEFPDLKGNPDWKEEVVKRFDEKIKSMDSEEEIVEYIVEELQKYGYILKKKQRSGFRPEAIK